MKTQLKKCPFYKNQILHPLNHALAVSVNFECVNPKKSINTLTQKLIEVKSLYDKLVYDESKNTFASLICPIARVASIFVIMIMIMVFLVY